MSYSIQIVMFAIYENPEQIFKALAAGAIGYHFEPKPSTKLLNAIRKANHVRIPINNADGAKGSAAFSGRHPPNELEELSVREQEVLELLAKGYLIKEIADQLGISFDTVRTYIRRIYEKMRVHSRSQAVAKYLQNLPTPPLPK